MINENTYGSSPAAVVLAKMINEKGFRTRKVGRILQDFNNVIANTNHVDVTTTIYLMKLAYNDSLKKCDSLETPFNTYTKNVLSTIYKVWCKRKNTLQPRKNRKL